MSTTNVNPNLLIETWQPITYYAARPGPGIEALWRLRDGQCALLVIKGLLSREELASVGWRVRQYSERATVTSYSNATLTTIGPYLAKHVRDPEPYFASAAATDEIFPYPAADLRLKLRQELAAFFGLQSLGVLRESNGQSYASGVIRRHADGVSNPLHNDRIRRDARGTGLRVAALKTQFSCIACIQECTEGGELAHYAKQWQPDDERFKIKDGLGYDPEVVAGYDNLCFKPQTGDVYVINPTYYHAIERVVGQERVTLGFFFGSFEDDSRTAFAWS